MIPYVRLHHHHRKDHLSGVVVHLGGGVPGVILGVERTGVAGIDFEYVGSDGSCDRSADLSLRSNGSGSDEFRVKTLTRKRCESYVYPGADRRVECVGDGLKIADALDLLSNVGGGLLACLLGIELLTDSFLDLINLGDAWIPVTVATNR